VQRERGFTLVELMVVVAIVSILASIALPAYSYYVMKSRIPDATSNLASKRVQQEQFFQDNRTYVNGTGCAADSVASQFFDFSCVNVSATTYTLQAVGKGPMAGFTYTVDETNAKASSLPGDWGGDTTGCWVSKKGGGC
jgi:type IV pilus assembly protein PilE